MPRQTNVLTAHNKKWNMYVNEVEKAEYLIALTKAGKARCQSAGVRAFMHLYATDEQVREKINNIIDDYIVYKDDGNVSQM